MAQIFGVFGSGLIKNNALLPAFLQSYLANNSAKTSETDIKIERIFPIISKIKPDTIMLGWGRKKSYRRASQFAQRRDLTMFTLEDGFLRSLTSGKNSRYACSMVIDPIGIYFNAKYPSYLESLIAKNELNSDQLATAQRLIQRILHERLSKYNATAKLGTLTGLNIQKTVKNILLIDQVAGDQSINGAGADKDSFAKMLATAQAHHPNAQLWIKAHPAGKVGYLTEIDLPSHINVIRDNVNPIELLEPMDEVYTVSSHMGFEALMCQKNGLGKSVHCFGVPWYAGWGLTDDSHAPQNVLAVAQKRRKIARQKNGLLQATLADLFYACYLQYSHYANPATGKACDIDSAIDWLVTNRTYKQKVNISPSPLLGYEFSGWKTGFVKAFFASSGKQLVFKAKPNTNIKRPEFFTKRVKLANFNEILVWGFAKKQHLQRQLSDQQIWCMEDGFIRSNGLGASLIEPLSVVVDHSGIYYNATAPSDLETLLANQNDLKVEQIERVNALQQRLLDQQVSKYNVGDTKPLILPPLAAGKEKILVVGQVEDDMSVQLCGSDIKSNLGLLKQVRQYNPTAFIIYKPHPDVQAGLRTGKISDSDMAIYADQVVLDIRMPQCLDTVDSVHTISSLTGFEALLRNKNVTCYGLPFYAGWGLTVDNVENAITQTILARRKFFRENNELPPLTLSQLIYATLIDYPLYHIPQGHGLAQVEDVIDFLYQRPQIAKMAEHDKKWETPKTHVKDKIKQGKPLLTTKFMQLRHQIQVFKQKKR